MTDVAAASAPAMASGGVAVPADAPTFHPATVRAAFPALDRRVGDMTLAYLDGPGGTQVPARTIERIGAYLSRSNANTHGAFATSAETDEIIAEAHAAAADFVGAADPAEIVFGPNMTTLTFALSRAIGRSLRPGDEVVVTRLDHDANVAPWLAVAEDRAATVRRIDVMGDGTLDLAGLERSIGPRTRIVAVGLASNALGTLNPVRRVVQLAHDAGAWTYIDAVHAAPHVPLDVVALDTDFLACSPYKFFGPHLGLVYGKRHHLDRLAAYKVRPSSDEPPGKWETGTQSHEAFAGLLGTFEYLEWLGTTHGGAPEGADRRGRLLAAMAAIRATERAMTPRLLVGLASVPGLTIHGITDPARVDERVPTVAFTIEGRRARDIAAALGRRGIAVWDGDFYAWELVRALGLVERGGLARVGLVHYNTVDEIDRLVGALREPTP